MNEEQLCRKAGKNEPNAGKTNVLLRILAFGNMGSVVAHCPPMTYSNTTPWDETCLEEQKKLWIHFFPATKLLSGPTKSSAQIAKVTNTLLTQLDLAQFVAGFFSSLLLTRVSWYFSNIYDFMVH